MSAVVPKFINNPHDVVQSALDGFCWTHSHCQRIENTNVIVDKYCDPSKVLLVSGGGSGHEPAHVGFVGRGWLSAAVCGNVFASPPSSDVSAAIDYLHNIQGPSGPGIIVVVKNYAGDVINFGYAVQQAKQQGIMVDMVLVADDVSCSIKDTSKRRGIAGTLLTYKMLGAAAMAGASLSELMKLAERTAPRLRSLGASLSSCAVPGSKLSSTIPDGKMEIGLGIHGEKGMVVVDAMPVTALVETLLGTLIEGRGIPDGDASDEWRTKGKLAVLVNNLGGTTDLEMYTITAATIDSVQRRGFEVVATATGRFMTALEMHGFSISLLQCDMDADAACLTHAEQEPFLVMSPPQAHSKPVPGPCSLTDMVCRLTTGDGREQRSVACDVLEHVFTSLGTMEAVLNSLDAEVGDGDLGSGVARAATSVLGILRRLPWETDPRTAFVLAAKAVADSCGGTSGPLYGAFILNGAVAALAELQSGRGTVDALRTGLLHGNDGVKALGGARKGDRTMIDALEAVIDSQEVQQATSLQDLLAAASRAAKAGAIAAAHLPARMGRARYLGGKEVGLREPGCELVAVWMELLGARLH